MRFTLNVNGAPRDVDVPKRATLLAVLRDDLGLTGTRYGCGVGQCGACFVLVNAGGGAPGVGAPGRVATRGATAVPSCLMSVEQATALEIVTVEGLSRDGQMHPVQAAFAETDAMQCGYCTSGMIVSAAALLARDARPDEGAIRDALGANLCRCGVYARAIGAVKRAAMSAAS